MKKSIEELWQTPYWIIDILPERVPKGSKGQYFAVDRYYLEYERFAAIKEKHINLILKLNCYKAISFEDGETNPPPEVIARTMKDKYVNIRIEDSLIVSEPDDTHLTVFNPKEELLTMIQEIIAGEGLFIWKGSEQ